MSEINNFVLDTWQNVVPQNDYIKDINDFFNTYRDVGNYLRAHHVMFDKIPDEGKPKAFWAMLLGGRVKDGVSSKI